MVKQSRPHKVDSNARKGLYSKISKVVSKSKLKSTPPHKVNSNTSTVLYSKNGKIASTPKLKMRKLRGVIDGNLVFDEIPHKPKQRSPLVIDETLVYIESPKSKSTVDKTAKKSLYSKINKGTSTKKSKSK